MENCIIPWWLLLLITILLSQMLTAGADSGRAAHHIRGRRRHRESNNEFFMVRSRELCSEANSESSSSSSSSSSSDDERDKCSALSSFPFLGRDNAERLLLREGVIDSIPKKCGNNGSKNVILAIGDGMGWEMVRAGAIARKVLDELQELGVDTKTGATGDIAKAAKEAFENRTLDDYYTQGKGSGLSFQDELDDFAIMTTSPVIIGEPNEGNVMAPWQSLLEGKVSEHEKGMSPLVVDECGNPLDFSPLDYSDGGNMVLWNDTRGGRFPWDGCYYEKEYYGSCDPTFIMQHAPGSAACATSLATGHKTATHMLGVNLYEEDVNTLVEEAMYCGKAGGVVSSVPMLHATPAAFITHVNNRHSVEQLQRSFKQVNPTLASGICVASGKPDSVTLGSMKNGALSSQWTFLYQQDVVKAEHFYYPIEEFDPDNGDHVLVCLGGDYSESQMDSLPLRGVDSTYSNRWCSRGTVVKDPEHGTPVRVEPNSELCKNYNPEELTQIPHISNNVKAALDFLGKASGGFFLMYEQGDIDKSAHGNQMDDMLGQMLDMDDSVRVILDWIYAHGGWEKNALYVTADHDHYLTLEPDFPQKLAYLLIDGESHNITPKNNTGIAAWDLAIQAGRHKDDSKTQVEHIREFTTWSEQDIKNVGHFWGPRGGGGNAYSSHTTRPVPLSYMGDDGCIEKLMGKGYQVVGRRVEGTKDKIDHVHLHACMLKNLFGLSRLPVVPPGDKKDVVHDLVHTSSSSIKMAGSVWPLVLMIGWGLGSALW